MGRVPSLTARQLAELIRQYCDIERLLAEHPEATRAQIDAFWARFGAARPERAAPREAPGLFDHVPEPPAAEPPAVRERAGEHLVVVARCDGGARGNPGPAGIGAVIEDTSGQTLIEVSEAIGRTTCNVAEYQAVLRALEKALELGATEIHLRLDSQLLVCQLDGSYRVKAAHLKPLHRRALALLRRFKRWDVLRVPRAENAAADALANRAMDGR